MVWKNFQSRRRVRFSYCLHLIKVRLPMAKSKIVAGPGTGYRFSPLHPGLKWWHFRTKWRNFCTKWRCNLFAGVVIIVRILLVLLNKSKASWGYSGVHSCFLTTFWDRYRLASDEGPLLAHHSRVGRSLSKTKISFRSDFADGVEVRCFALLRKGWHCAQKSE